VLPLLYSLHGYLLAITGYYSVYESSVPGAVAVPHV
jgi:hypothetical protein